MASKRARGRRGPTFRGTFSEERAAALLKTTPRELRRLSKIGLAVITTTQDGQRRVTYTEMRRLLGSYR